MPDPPSIRVPGAAPNAVRATAAMAWLAAAFCLIRALMLCDEPQSMPAGMFFLGLGGGAIYLAVSLPRRVVSAWTGCRTLASVIGAINLAILPSLVVGWGIAIGWAVCYGVEVSAAERTQALAAAGAATALPWAFYHALGDAHVRGWFCAGECRRFDTV